MCTYAHMVQMHPYMLCLYYLYVLVYYTYIMHIHMQGHIRYIYVHTIYISNSTYMQMLCTCGCTHQCGAHTFMLMHIA